MLAARKQRSGADWGPCRGPAGAGLFSALTLEPLHSSTRISGERLPIFPWPPGLDLCCVRGGREQRLWLLGSVLVRLPGELVASHCLGTRVLLSSRRFFLIDVLS